MKKVKIAMMAMLSLLLLLAMVGYFFFKSTLCSWEGVLTDCGVARAVDIVRNAHGVPSIKAAASGDLFYAIGFVHAQDRLFQMDFMRRAALGRLAEVFGDRALEQDIWQRYLQAEAGIEKSFRALKPDVKRLLAEYCRGVNYFLASQSLPPEFHILRYAPETWQIRDVLAVMKYLESELTCSGGELSHARLLAALAPEYARRWLAVPWADFSSVHVSWPQVFADPMPARLLEAEAKSAQPGSRGLAWAVAGSRTASGLPILANDFSWAPVIPALFYQLAGRTPLLEISGNTLPGVPFIFSGRTWQLGWGINAVGNDTLDYFVLERHSAKPYFYRSDGQWLALQIREQKIRCRGREDFVFRQAFSKYGPVIETSGCLLAVHSLVQYRSSALDALSRMNFARNLKEFTAALRKFSAPALRVVFADRKGNIGACQAGLTPLRGKGNGLLPVRARASSDIWQDFREAAAEKIILNPGKGWLTTADLETLGEADPVLFKFDPAPDPAGQRLAEQLAAAGSMDLAAASRLQNDSKVAGAEFLIDLVQSLPLSRAGARSVRTALSSWDLDTGDEEGPTFYYEFEKRLAKAIFIPAGSDPAAASLPPARVIALLKFPTLMNRQEVAAAVEKGLESTDDAYRRQTRGQDDGWRWESLHTVSFHHALGTIFPLRTLFGRGSLSSKGGKYCLLNTDFNAAGDFKTTSLAAYKMIIDFSDFSKSLLVYPTGQSGHPLSPAYDDQMDTYAALKYLKMENPGNRAYRLRLLPVAEREVR